jgi:glycosyltransferase involved in cell wall biosynthesis
MNPLVSIVIPCFNQSKFLDDCINSIIMQTYLNWECIIVNDGSEDDTEIIAKKWCKKNDKIKYLYQKNKGTSSAKNFGIVNSKGDWVQILDADDLLEKNKIQYQIDNLRNYSAEILISGYRYFYHTEGINYLRIIGRYNIMPDLNLQQSDTVDIIDVFKNRNPFVISAPIYNKIVFEKVGLFDEKMDVFEDWDFHLRCALFGIKFQHTGYHVLNKTLIRIHDESCMSSTVKFSDSYQYFRTKHSIEIGFRGKKKFVLRIKKLIRFISPPIIIYFFNFIRTKK